VLSIDRVSQELTKGQDELWSWARDHFSSAFASTNEKNVIEVYGDIMKWAKEQTQFTAAARAGLASGADAWLVAYAKAKGCNGGNPGNASTRQQGPREDPGYM